jgi:hypothetical protein
MAIEGSGGLVQFGIELPTKFDRSEWVFVEAAPGRGGTILVNLMLSLVFLLCLALLLGLLLRNHPVVTSSVAALLGDKHPERKNTSLFSLGFWSSPGLTPYRVVAAVTRTRDADPNGRASRVSAANGLTCSARLACGDSLVPPFGGPR